jgi:hypothetical protein
MYIWQAVREIKSNATPFAMNQHHLPTNSTALSLFWFRNVFTSLKMRFKDEVAKASALPQFFLTIS